MKYYRDARIPFACLHDTGGTFGGAHYVDIPNIFPNFDADENLPESYGFAFTDEVIKNPVNNGVEPFYRLGCTIENNCQLRAYAIYPPKDPNKWARICEHVIRHYTEGWADGFNFKIMYWEIWNEPDMMKNPMWRGMSSRSCSAYFTGIPPVNVSNWPVYYCTTICPVLYPFVSSFSLPLQYYHLSGFVPFRVQI